MFGHRLKTCNDRCALIAAFGWKTGDGAEKLVTKGEESTLLIRAMHEEYHFKAVQSSSRRLTGLDLNHCGESGFV